MSRRIAVDLYDEIIRNRNVEWMMMITMCRLKNIS